MGRVTIVETDLEFRGMNVRPVTEMIVIHHVGDLDRDVSAEEIHGWHLGNGWAGIGYHYVIRQDGTIERGRPREYTGSHAQGFNSRSIGINVVGNLQENEPTDAQIVSLCNLVADLAEIYELEINDDTLLGHCDLMSTDCPGEKMWNRLAEVRETTNKLLCDVTE